MVALNAVGMNAVATSNASTAAPSSLSCTLVATASASANLASQVTFSCNLSAASSVAASLKTSITLSALLLAQSSLQSILSTGAALQATITSQCVVSANLTTTQMAPTFVPSVARTIYVQATSPVFTGSKWWTLTDPKKPRGLKDPDATIDITFDWTSWLDDIGNASISDISFTLVGLNNAGTFYDSDKATVFVSGGVVGSPATIACKIRTNTTPSRTDERTVYIDISDE